MPSGKLNVFQQLALQWESLHPYNAAQCCVITSSGDLSKWSTAWQQTIQASGLGGYHIEAGRLAGLLGGRFHMSRLPQATAPLLLQAPTPADIEDFISDQLNQPFIDGELPLRPMICRQRNAVQLCVVYRHVVADSVAIRLLLQDWIARALGLAPVITKPLKVNLPSYSALFAGAGTNSGTLQTILESARWAGQMRRSRRLEPNVAQDLRCKYSGGIAHGVCPDRLSAGCRSLGVTVGDYLMAAVAEAMATFAPPPAFKQRRGMVVGQVVDLRRHIRPARAAEESKTWFGLYLGFATCVCDEQSLDNFPSLLKCTSQHSARHSRRQKSLARAEVSRMIVRMLAGLWMSRGYSQRRLADFYRRRMPLAAGISNVNLNHHWSWMRQDIRDRIEHYERVSPTGPLMPLVISATAHRGELHLGMTRRSGLISDTIAEAIRSKIIGRLTQAANSSAQIAPLDHTATR